MTNMTKCKLSPLALGLAFGALWALSVLLLGLLTALGFENTLVASLRAMHVAYNISVIGVLVASLLAFLDGFFRGAILGLLYNLFIKCCCCNKEGKCG